eukprot:UN00844
MKITILPTTEVWEETPNQKRERAGGYGAKKRVVEDKTYGVVNGAKECVHRLLFRPHITVENYIPVIHWGLSNLWSLPEKKLTSNLKGL